jgi:preprotein translocase subunit SecA
MRIFGSEKMDTMLSKLGLKDGEAIVHPWINKALEKAQQKVEARNYEIRKNLLKFDDVMNDQRKVIYDQRKDLMTATDVSSTIADMRHEAIRTAVSRCIPERAYAEQWEVDALHEEGLRLLGRDLPVADWAKEEGIADEEIADRMIAEGDRLMAEKAANYTPAIMRLAEKSILLQLLDQTWKEHLLGLDHLRQGIGLRAYGQKDPLNEYKREAFDLFNAMLDQLRETTTSVMCHLDLEIRDPEEMTPRAEREGIVEHRDDAAMAGAFSGGEPDGLHPAATLAQGPMPRGAALAGAVDEVPPGWTFYEPLGRHLDPQNPETWGKVPRNAACPCGSGKKYKHCHGRVA